MRMSGRKNKRRGKQELSLSSLSLFPLSLLSSQLTWTPAHHGEEPGPEPRRQMHRHPVLDPRNGQDLLLDRIIARELRGVDDRVARDVGPQPRPQRREALSPDDGRVGPKGARVPPRRARRELALRLHPHFHEVGRARNADGERSRRESRHHLEAEAVVGGAGRVGDGALERVVEADAEAWVFWGGRARFWGKASPSLVRGGRERERSERAKTKKLDQIFSLIFSPP